MVFYKYESKYKTIKYFLYINRPGSRLTGDVQQIRPKPFVVFYLTRCFKPPSVLHTVLPLISAQSRQSREETKDCGRSLCRVLPGSACHIIKLLRVLHLLWVLYQDYGYLNKSDSRHRLWNISLLSSLFKDFVFIYVMLSLSWCVC